MTFRASYSAEPGLADRIFELLEQVFPGLGTARRDGERFGVGWEACSTPFVAREGGRIVGHVGLLPVPLHLMGRDVVVGGVHAVATDPEYRRRGLFRALLGELLSYAADRYPSLMLTTLHPEYFTRFGFRVVPEWVHRARAVDPVPVPDARRLDLAVPGDLALLHDLLDRRTPTSRYLGVGTEKGCFGFVEYRSVIRYSERLDAAIIFERSDRNIRIYDVIASRIPSARELVGLVGGSSAGLLSFFAPDRVAGSFRAEPHDLGGGPDALEPGTAGWVLMARGPFAPQDHPIMLPRPTRC